GGSLNIGQSFGNLISSITVPQNVTVLDRASTLDLSGNLTNSGSLFVVPSNSVQTTASIQAANIFNNPGGLISSILPAGLATSGGLSLKFTAINSIVNAGTISSAANLNLSAPSVTNALPQGTTGMRPMIQSLNDMNIVTSALTNSGLISSLAGNLSIVPAVT